MQEPHTKEWNPLDISETDVVEAMKGITGYIDITPGNFKEIYQAAYALAINRLVSTLKAGHIMTGYLYVVIPTALGAIVMLIVALIINNIPKSRKYPEFWF